MCNIITDEERKLFGLEDRQIKSMIETVHGKRPNDAFVREPTPWNGLYKTYHWPEVQRITTVRSAEFIEFNHVPVIVSEGTLINDSTKPGTFSTNLATNVTNSTSTTWTQTHGISVGQKISYSVKFGNFVKCGGETSFQYSHSWGEGGSQTKTTSSGVGANISVQLEPGEKVRAQIIASRANAKIKVEYESYLIGDIAVNYCPTHKGHHFWAFDVNRVLKENNRQNLVVSTETIVVEMFSKMEVKLCRD
ncbi:spherulin-2A-like [Sitodiplosis mosellana]|uniref:spherulin-2A-like n=1 Tax=Sitodiplosis mosellana TaxID=263140 RepID=UPI00244439FC|nr:spherulin-2A-like [Sitodiplosis mosellana]